MTQRTNEEIARSLLAHEGVLAVRVERCGGAAAHCSVHKPEAPAAAKTLLEGAMQVFEMFQYQEPLRIVGGADTSKSMCITIACFCDYGVAVAVLTPTGHRIHKSLRRLTFRTLNPGHAIKPPLKPRKAPAAEEIVAGSVKPGDAA